MELISVISLTFIPLLIGFILLYGTFKHVPTYESFVEGGKEVMLDAPLDTVDWPISLTDLSLRSIGRVGIGLGARSDSPERDISTPEKLKQTLLGVDTLSFNKVQSGNYFATVLGRLGIAETLKPKIVRTSP